MVGSLIFFLLETSAKLFCENFGKIGQHLAKSKQKKNVQLFTDNEYIKIRLFRRRQWWPSSTKFVAQWHHGRYTVNRLSNAFTVISLVHEVAQSISGTWKPSLETKTTNMNHQKRSSCLTAKLILFIIARALVTASVRHDDMTAVYPRRSTLWMYHWLSPEPCHQRLPNNKIPGGLRGLYTAKPDTIDWFRRLISRLSHCNITPTIFGAMLSRKIAQS